MPGKTDTGFALELATIDFTGGLTAEVTVVVACGGAGTFLCVGGGGGGGGGVKVVFVFEGTRTR